MKKLVCILSVLALVLSVGAAWADQATPEPQFEATRRFISLVEKNGMYYTYQGVTESGADLVTMSYTGFVVRIYFRSDGHYAEVLVFDLIVYNDADLPAVLSACNELNSTYRFCSFYANAQYHGVDARCDLIFGEAGTPEQAAYITLEAVQRVANIVRESLPSLTPYNTAETAQ